MHYEDLEQDEKLDNASEERIFKYLDEIVEDGKYTPPDIFMDLALANELTVKYLNLYLACGKRPVNHVARWVGFDGRGEHRD